MKTKHGGKRECAGRPPSGNPMQIKSFRLTMVEIGRIKKACAQNGQSMSEFVRRAITAALEKMKL